MYTACPAILRACLRASSAAFFFAVIHFPHSSGGRRLRGLEGTPYARSFLLGLAHNSGLLVAAEAYGCVPEEIERILDQPSQVS